MARRLIGWLFFAALCSCATPHDQMMKELVQGEPAIGPKPDKASGTALIEAAVRATLKDPYSAQFSWPNDFRQDWYKPLLRSRIYGWIICGTVNAKNSYGGYVGYVGSEAVVGIIANGQVVFSDVDDGRYPILAQQCVRVIILRVPTCLGMC